MRAGVLSQLSNVNIVKRWIFEEMKYYRNESNGTFDWLRNQNNHEYVGMYEKDF